MTGSRSQLPSLALVCLGAPAVRIDGAAPDGSVIWRKNLALLMYLALAERQTSSRGHLVGLLWPDKPEDKARHSLNEAVRRLRGALGPDRLISDGERLTLSADDLSIDAAEFEDVVRRDPVRAVQIPAGEFLDGLVIEDAPPFEQWVAVQRDRYNALWAGALVATAEGALSANRLADAQASARRALRVEPFNEPAVRILIRAAALGGDASGAQAIYHDFQVRLAESLGAAPSQELDALIARVRDQRWRTARPSPLTRDDPRLSGRPETHRVAFEVMSDRSPGAKCLVVTGGPGMGKTRLLNECLDRAGLDGGLVVVARPLENDQDNPWSTLRSIMRSGLADAPGMAGAPPQALSTLAAFVPDLASRFEPVSPQDAGEIVQSFMSFLSAVCDEQEVVIAIDDAHLADRSTLGVLEGALPHIREVPVTVVLTVGTSVSVPPELLRLQAVVGHAVPGVAIELAPLDEEGVRGMVEQLAPWCSSPGDVDRLTRRLLFEVEGNPLLAVTILRALGEQSLAEQAQAWPRPRATIETPLPFTIPALLRSAVLARVEVLQSGPRAVLEAASVGHVTVDPMLIAGLLDISQEDVELHLETLERQEFMRYEEDSYIFAAPFLKKAIDEACLTAGQRRRWVKKSLEILAEREDRASCLLRVELSSRSGDHDRAFEEAMSIARAAIADGGYATARRALAAAEHAAGADEARHTAVAAARDELYVKPPPPPVRP